MKRVWDAGELHIDELHGGRGRIQFLSRRQARYALYSSDPDLAILVAMRSLHLAGGETIGDRKMMSLARDRVHPVNAVAGADVNAAPPVFSDRLDFIAGWPGVHVVDCEFETLRLRVVNA